MAAKVTKFSASTSKGGGGKGGGGAFPEAKMGIKKTPKAVPKTDKTKVNRFKNEPWKKALSKVITPLLTNKKERK